MRLIDADAFNDWILSRFAEPQNALILTLQGFIAEQPTAYSVDNVAEELEELKMRYYLTIANTGDEKSDFAYENVGNALDKAIEIVKRCGGRNNHKR